MIMFNEKDPYTFNTKTMLNEYLKVKSQNLEFPFSKEVEMIKTPSLTIIYATALTVFYTYGLVVLSNKELTELNRFLQIVNCFCGSLIIVTLTVMIHSYLKNYDADCMLEKHQLFNDMLSENKNYDIAQILDDVEGLNDETIDNFSLSEIKRVCDNIAKAEENTFKLERNK